MRWLRSPIAPLDLLVTGLLFIAILAIHPDTRSGMKRVYTAVFGKGWGYFNTPEGELIETDSPIVPLAQKPTPLNELLHIRSLPIPREERKKVRKLIDRLCDKYPSDIRVLTERCRIALNACRLAELSRTEYPFPGREDKTDRERWVASHGERLRLIELCKRGEKLDASNAFFPLAAAVAWEAEKNRKECSSALRRARSKTMFDNYAYELIQAEQDAREAIVGKDPIWRFNSESSETYEPEFRALCVRLARDNTDAGLTDRAAFAEASIKIALGSKTVFGFTRPMSDLSAVCNPHRHGQGIYRSVGDTAREATRFQDRLAALGKPLTFEAPAAIAVASRVALSFGEMGDQYQQIGSGESMMHGAVNVAYSLVGLLAIAALCIALGFVNAPVMPRESLPALAAFAFSLRACIGDINVIDSDVLHLIVGYALVFALSFSQGSRKASQVIGVTLSALGILIGALGFAEGNAYEWLPSMTYLIAQLRYWWLSKTGPSTSLIIVIGVVSVAVSAIPPYAMEKTSVNWPGFALIFGMLLLAVCTWQSVFIGEAAKQIVRASGYAGILGIVLLGYFAYQQSVVETAIEEVQNREASMLRSLQRQLSECAPLPTAPHTKSTAPSAVY